MGLGEALFTSTLATLENVGKSTMDTVTMVVSDVSLTVTVLLRRFAIALTFFFFFFVTQRPKGREEGDSTEKDFGKHPVTLAKEFEDRAGTARISVRSSIYLSFDFFTLGGGGL